MNGFQKLVALGALAAATTPFAFATTVTPAGPVVTAAPVTVTNDGIVAQISGSLSARTFTGSYTEYVIQDGSNPYGANDLTFVIEVSNSTSSSNGIEHVSDGSTNGFSMLSSVNVGYASSINGITGISGTTPTDVPLSVDETMYGTVEFNFTGSSAIAQGTTTDYLVIQTSATNYTMGNLGVIDSSTDTETGLVPAAATPEPSSLALLGTGLIGGASTLLRRRRSGVKVA